MRLARVSAEPLAASASTRMRTVAHAVIAAGLAVLVAAAVHATAFFAWLTAYYTQDHLVRSAQVRANIWLAVLIAAVAGFVLNAWWWWRSRQKVG